MEATPRTLPGLDMQELGRRKAADTLEVESAQVLHGCRQLVP